MLESGGFIFHNERFLPITLDNASTDDDNYDHRNDSLDNELVTCDQHEDWHEISPSIMNIKQEMDETDEQIFREHILFVHKPSGLLSVPGKGPQKADCLSARVARKYPSAKICHRLDRDTSGVMVFGLCPDVHKELSRQFEAKETNKTYVALVNGHLKHDKGSINLPIGKQKTLEGFNRWVIGGEKQRDAYTEYKVLKRFKSLDGVPYSKVEVYPRTGRGHQIRLHMKAIGHPLLGDTLHAPHVVAHAAPRLCLHAQSLTCQVFSSICQAESNAPF